MRRPRAQLPRLLLATVFAAVVGLGAIPAIHQPAVAQAATVGAVESGILTLINQNRAAGGLAPYRSDLREVSLAEYRAGVMAATHTMSHTVAGCLSCELTARGIQWYSEGESIAWTSYSSDSAAAYFVKIWMSDSIHRALLMSAKFNYVGVGVAFGSGGTTWTSVVLTESADHTRPYAWITAKSRVGSKVAWSWSGADVRLQTHTAGLRNYDVEYRVGYGTWTFIKSWTTSTYLALYSRPSGHYYGIRVRSRDWAGNVGYWSAESRIWVP